MTYHIERRGTACVTQPIVMMQNRQAKRRLLASRICKRDAPGSASWACRCGVSRTQRASAYSNLVYHITGERAGGTSDEVGSRPAAGLGFKEMWSETASRVHAWMEVVVFGMMPFDVLENNVMRLHMRPENTSTGTMVKYLALRTQHVDTKEASTLPSEFAIVFKGCLTGSTQYLGIYATFLNNESKVPSIGTGFLSPFHLLATRSLLKAKNIRSLKLLSLAFSIRRGETLQRLLVKLFII